MSGTFAGAKPSDARDLRDALRGCAAGDRASLRLIYDLESPAMIGVAMRILRRRDLAEEAVHDTFMRVWQKAASFDPARGEARSWLYAVLRHRALNILRGEKRTDQVEDFDTLGLESEDESPEACVARLSDEKALKRCLEQLEPARRNAIVLAYVQGLTHGELAGRLGLPLGTVKSWIRRSLVTLKECMA
ncbi:MAG: sigma-70 family RNA polymerase sigma factor [Beijerinckiaceae bacterium]|nr:sigma-70 family RNA polymerase sigma factor [Beijerinckiaceae bacterium]MDO9443377.1 sigma-70 family RNA polymerase sigma factor [Beijerinckiaceae bacterium]